MIVNIVPRAEVASSPRSPQPLCVVALCSLHQHATRHKNSFWRETQSRSFNSATRFSAPSIVAVRHVSQRGQNKRKTDGRQLRRARAIEPDQTMAGTANLQASMTSQQGGYDDDDEESLSPLEQEVLDEYARLLGNLNDVRCPCRLQFPLSST